MEATLAEPALSIHHVLAIVLTSLAVMGSPGPATISVTAAGAAFGFRRSLPYLAGLILGTGAVLAAVASGIGAALLAVPWIASFLTAVSTLYMLYLAFRIATAPPLTDGVNGAPAPSLAAGFLLALANPKAYLAIAAVYAGSALAAAPKTAILAAMIAAIHIVWLLAGASLSRMLAQPRVSRIVNIALAVMLAAATLGPLMTQP